MIRPHIIVAYDNLLDELSVRILRMNNSRIHAEFHKITGNRLNWSETKQVNHQIRALRQSYIMNRLNRTKRNDNIKNYAKLHSQLRHGKPYRFNQAEWFMIKEF